MEFPKHQVGPRQPFESPDELFAAEITKFMVQVESDIAVEIYHEAHGMHGASDEEKEEAEKEYFAKGKLELEAMLKDSPVKVEVMEVYDAYASGDIDADEAQSKIKTLIVAG